MRASIEDTIIAYFDHRLSDAESADLLHRVSTDPKSHQLFKQHEAVRTRMNTASAGVVVFPRLDDKVMANIAALQRQDGRKFAFLRTSTLMLGSAVAAGLAIVFYLVTANVHTNSQATLLKTPSAVAANAQPRESTTQEFASAASSTSTSTTQSDLSANQNVVSQGSTIRSTGISKHRVHTSRVHDQETFPSEAVVASNVTSTNEAANLDPIPAIQIKSTLPTSAGNISDFTPGQTLAANSLGTVDNLNATFELAIQGATGSMIENDLRAFGGLRAQAGYFLTGADLAGIRVTSSRLRRFSNTAPTGTDHDGAYYTSELRGGVFIEHREPLLDGRILVLGAVGAGISSIGNQLSADLGFLVPLNARLSTGITFELSNDHYYTAVNYRPAHDGPSGQNVLDGRLNYGMTYAF
jgi:hypothetical protein